jgi:hypothetical protein
MSPDVLGAFEGWLADHADTLAIPMNIVSRTPTVIKATFVGITKTIVVVMVCGDIVVEVRYQGVCWDFLATFESIALDVEDSLGVVCDWCNPADRVVYPDRVALFMDHVVKPYAVWIETVLAPAHALGLGGSDDDSTWATLLPASNDRGYRVTIPLRGS